MTVLDLERELSFLQPLNSTIVDDHSLNAPGFAALVHLPNAEGRQVTVAIGAQTLVLTRFSSPVGHAIGSVSANDLGFQHVALVVSDMDAAYAKLMGVEGMQRVSPAPQTLPLENPVAGGVRALYFRDPEGHFMELLWFPPNKGAPAWHVPTRELFLGIDHSAIVSKSTADSLRFYRDALGLQVVSQSINEGPAQARLSGVPGARVRITSLRGATGPGIELLEYLMPVGGKPFPAAGPADAVEWQIALDVPDVDAALRALRATGLGTVPATGTDVSGAWPRLARAAIVKDPDGHSLFVSERVSTLHEATIK